MLSVKEFYEYLWATDFIMSGAGEVNKSIVTSRSSQLPPPPRDRKIFNNKE